WAATHIRTARSDTPRNAATCFWVYPSATRLTASRRRASNSPAVPFTHIPHVPRSPSAIPERRRRSVRSRHADRRTGEWTRPRPDGFGRAIGGGSDGRAVRRTLE